MSKEIWKTIVGFEDYQISNLGKVKSLKYGKERILKPATDEWGYFRVCLNQNKKQAVKKIHKLVAIAFLNHVPCGMELVIDHINDIPTDNRVENLQIVTNRFNICKTQTKYSSNYKGVDWWKRDKKWRAKITINGKSKHLGLFDCEIKASEAYQNAVNNL